MSRRTSNLVCQSTPVMEWAPSTLELEDEQTARIPEATRLLALSISGETPVVTPILAPDASESGVHLSGDYSAEAFETFDPSEPLLLSEAPVVSVSGIVPSLKKPETPPRPPPPPRVPASFTPLTFDTIPEFAPSVLPASETEAASEAELARDEADDVFPTTAPGHRRRVSRMAATSVLAVVSLLLVVVTAPKPVAQAAQAAHAAVALRVHGPNAGSRERATTASISTRALTATPGPARAPAITRVRWQASTPRSAPPPKPQKGIIHTVPF